MSNSFVADDIDDSVIGTSKIFKFCIRLDLWSRKTGLIGITVPFVFVNYEIFGSIFIFSILGFPTFVNILTYQLRECKRLTCFKNDKNFSWMVKRVRFFTWRGSRFGPAIKRPLQISVELPIRNRRPLCRKDIQKLRSRATIATQLGKHIYQVGPLWLCPNG